MSHSVSLANTLYQQLTQDQRKMLPEIPHLRQGQESFSPQDLANFRLSLTQVLQYNLSDNILPQKVLEIVAALRQCIYLELGSLGIDSGKMGNRYFY